MMEGISILGRVNVVLIEDMGSYSTNSIGIYGYYTEAERSLEDSS